MSHIWWSLLSSPFFNYGLEIFDPAGAASRMVEVPSVGAEKMCLTALTGRP